METSSTTKMRFEDIAQLRRDFYVPSENESLNYIGLEHINQQSLDLNGIGDSATVVSQKNRFFSGDILFGKLRPYFRKVVRPKFDGVCSTDIWVINAKPGIDQAYLFYLLASPKFIDASVAGSSGTRMPRADWDYLSETEWDIPTLEVQKRIGEILSSLDDKIELNRRMNETLEAIAQAIFKEWFVDFNYPGATGKLVPSPLGPIPEGWNVGKTGDFFDITMGQSPPGSSFNTEGIGIPFFQGRADFTFRFPKTRVYTNSPTRFAFEDETLVSVRAPIGDINVSKEKCCIGRGLASVLEKKGNKSYTFYYLKSIVSILKEYEDTGTVFGSLSRKDFENISYLSPEECVVTLFEKTVKEIDMLIKKTEENNQVLGNIRNTMLSILLR